MGIETGTNIAALDSTWPLSGDVIQQGDDHLRLLKAVLKAQFPGAGGLGFALPITATEAELNFTSGVTSNIQSQIDSISAVSGIEIPSGTIMLFYQGAAPTGWTQIANDDNSMLRMVSGVGGGIGGSDSPIDFAYDHTHTTGNHTLTIAEMPSHSHGAPSDGGSSYSSSTRFRRESGNIGNIFTNPEGGGGAHNHGETLSASSALSFTPRYVNIIQASKD